MQVHRDIVQFISDTGGLEYGTQVFQKRLTTTDATVTPIWEVPIAELEAIAVTVRLLGKKSDATAAFGSQGLCEARRAAAGNVTVVGTAVTTAREDSAGTPAITFAADTTNQTLEIRCTGIAAETWQWEAFIQVTKV